MKVATCKECLERYQQSHHNQLYCSQSCVIWSKIKRGSFSDWDECWEWTGGKNPDGYGVYRFRTPPKTVRAHRFVYEETHGKISKGRSVCHSCDNPACCRPSHLFLGDHAENMADMRRKGRAVGHVGETNPNPNVRMNETAVKVLRHNSLRHKRHVDFAEHYGITPEMVSPIRRGLAWEHVG